MAGIGKNKSVASNSPLAKARASEKVGVGKVPNRDVAQRFKKHFESLSTNEKHATVQKLMKRKFGNKSFQKAVYGKNYKPGTVGKMTKTIQQTRKKEKTLNNLIKSTQSELASASNESKQALQKKLLNLTERKSTADNNIGNIKLNREHYLNLRDKALQQIAVKANQNPKAFNKKRKELVKSQIEKSAKKTKPTKTGGTEAP